MKIRPSIKRCLLANFLLLPFLVPAQLRLQSISGKKTAEIPLGSTIELKLPAPGEAGDPCEYYWSYNGVLKGTESGKAKLLVHEETLMYQETNGLVKKVNTNYAYPQKEIYTDIDLAPAFSVTKYSKSGDARKGFGALIIGAALLHSVAISPFLSDKARDVSDKIVWGGVGVGVTLILLPSKKTWYLQQPTGKNKRLWQFR